MEEYFIFAEGPRGWITQWPDLYIRSPSFLFHSPFPSLIFGNIFPHKLFIHGMANLTCQLSWPTMPRYMVKHFSGCFCKDAFG